MSGTCRRRSDAAPSRRGSLRFPLLRIQEDREPACEAELQSAARLPFEFGCADLASEIEEDDAIVGDLRPIFDRRLMDVTRIIAGDHHEDRSAIGRAMGNDVGVTRWHLVHGARQARSAALPSERRRAASGALPVAPVPAPREPCGQRRDCGGHDSQRTGDEWIEAVHVVERVLASERILPP